MQPTYIVRDDDIDTLPPEVAGFLRCFTNWAEDRPDILAVALVGSYARGTARPDSDVDLVIVSSNPAHYLCEVSWTMQFGKVKRYQTEDYGKLTSVRVWYGDGLEVEYGLTAESWAAMPLDEGTQQVISDGIRVLLEHGELLSRHQKRR